LNEPSVVVGVTAVCEWFVVNATAECPAESAVADYQNDFFGTFLELLIKFVGSFLEVGELLNALIFINT
jgi:hypothetical protein